MFGISLLSSLPTSKLSLTCPGISESTRGLSPASLESFNPTCFTFSLPGAEYPDRQLTSKWDEESKIRSSCLCDGPQTRGEGPVA